MDGETRITFEDLARLGIRPVAGGELDLGDEQGDESQDDAGARSAGDGTVAEGQRTGTDAATGIEIEGQRYTPDQVKAALEALSSKGKWEGELTRRSQGIAQAKKVLEWVMGGKAVEQFTQDDFDDLEAYGLLNRRLRRDDGFRSRWFKTFNQLVDEYERAGASPLQAERAAGTRIARAQQQGETPGQVQADPQTGKRLDRMERWASGREIRDLQTFIGDSAATSLEVTAKGIEPWHDEIGELILSRVQTVDDTQLVPMMYDGRLAHWINDLATYYTKKFRAKIDGQAKTKQDGLVTTAQDLQRTKAGTPPTPVGSGASAPAPPGIPEAVKGRGMSGLHERAAKLG